MNGMGVYGKTRCKIGDVGKNDGNEIREKKRERERKKSIYNTIM